MKGSPALTLLSLMGRDDVGISIIITISMYNTKNETVSGLCGLYGLYDLYSAKYRRVYRYPTRMERSEQKTPVPRMPES